MRKLFKKLHLYLSLPAGIIIVIICFTGFVMSLDDLIRPLWSGWPEVYRTMMGLHRWLLDPTRAVGKLVVGITTITFIIILLTGLFVWLPKKWNKIKNNLSVKMKGGYARVLLDLHRVLGVYTLLVMLLLCLTGLMWSFEGYRNTVSDIITVERVPNRVAIANKKNRETGEMVRIDFNERDNKSKVMRWAYLLHTGQWGGWFGPIFTGLISLFGATLPITGYMLYIKRIRRRKRVK